MIKNSSVSVFSNVFITVILSDSGSNVKVGLRAAFPDSFYLIMLPFKALESDLIFEVNLSNYEKINYTCSSFCIINDFVFL